MKKICLLCSLLLALGILFTISSRSYGTVLKKMDTKELTNSSDAIVVGKVTSKKAQWNDNGKKIYTHVTLSVERYVKGTHKTSEITIKQLGGEVGGVGLMVVGAPEYTEGEDVLVFLKGCNSHHFECVGMAQGKYSIKTDAATKKKILVREMDRLEGKRLDLMAPEGTGEKLFLDDFINQINSIIEEKR